MKIPCSSGAGGTKKVDQGKENVAPLEEKLGISDLLDLAADNLKLPRQNFKHFAKRLVEEGITDEDSLRATSDSKLRTCGLPAILIGNLSKVLQ